MSEPKGMKLESWKKMWDSGTIPFHVDGVHPSVLKYHEKLTMGKYNSSVFFPLCGKSVDMKWMYDRGHSVAGLEISEVAIKDFFKGSNLEYVEENLCAVDGKIFKSLDGRLCLYACDLFKFNSSISGCFDGIFDRGSLVAINPCDRERYASLLSSLMKPESCMLLEAVKYDPSEYGGPPHHLSDEELQGLYGSGFTIKSLERNEKMPEEFKAMNMTYFATELYEISPK